MASVAAFWLAALGCRVLAARLFVAGFCCLLAAAAAAAAAAADAAAAAAADAAAATAAAAAAAPLRHYQVSSRGAARSN